jgi:uncharacterized membrane protein YbhN (UPF0104 family)
MARIVRIPIPVRVWLWRALSLLAALALVAFMLSLVDWNSFSTLLQGMSPSGIVLAFLIYVVLNYFRAERYIALLQTDALRARDVFLISLYHNFLVRLLPFKLGEMTYILLMRSRHQVSPRDGVSSLFGSRLFELLVILLVGAVALWLSGIILPDHNLLIFTLVIISIGGGLLGFLYAGRILQQIANRLARWQHPAARLSSLAQALDRLRYPRVFSRALFWSIFTYGCSFAVNLALLWAADVQIAPADLILTISLGMFATAFPFSLSGFGAVELSFAFGLVNLAGYSAGDATSIGLMLNGMQLIFAALSGLLGYLLMQRGAPGRN